LIVLTVFVVRTSASDCLDYRLWNDLQCVEWDVKPYSLTHCCRITAVCGAYYIGGREFDSLSDLIGYYTSYSDLLKGERLQTPVPPPEVGKQATAFIDCNVLLISWVYYHMHYNHLWNIIGIQCEFSCKASC